MHTDRGELSAPLVVDGLGWRRVLSNGPTIQPPDARLSRGLEVHPAGRGEEMELWIDPRYVRAGYGWSFPAATSCASASAPSGRRTTSSSRPCGSPRDLGLPPERYQGNWIPHQLRPAVEDGVFFVGDSAGHCLPLTAEGIRTALYFGLACGRELRAVLEGRRTRAQALARYGAFSDAHAAQIPLAAARPARDRAADAEPLDDARSSRAFENRRVCGWAFDHYLAIAPPSFVAAAAHRAAPAAGAPEPRSRHRLSVSGSVAQATLRRRAPACSPASSASRLASIALAQETSASMPGAATMSPARNTPSPRSTAGRSRQLVPGMSSAPDARVHHLAPAPRLAPAPVLEAASSRRSRRIAACSALSPGRIGICAWISSSPAGAMRGLVAE